MQQFFGVTPEELVYSNGQGWSRVVLAREDRRRQCRLVPRSGVSQGMNKVVAPLKEGA